MSQVNDAFVEELQALFTKYEIAHAFMAIPQPEAEHYVLLPYQMGNNAVRHLAASLLQNISSVPAPTLN